MIKKRIQRQSNFELLRIIAMFSIIIHHAVVHGIFLVPVDKMLANSSWKVVAIYNSIAFFGKVGVYIFILITGYFMINSRISISKVIRIWLPIFFWSVMLTSVVGGVTHTVSKADMIHSFFPIFYNVYWFMTTYLVVYLLTPLLNRGINGLTKRLELLLILVTVFTFITQTGNWGEWELRLILVYCIGALIRKHQLLSNRKYSKVGLILINVSLLLEVGTAFGYSYQGFKLYSEQTLATLFSIVPDGFGIVGLIMALGMFMWFGTIQFKHNLIINTLSSTTFGIYLIHDSLLARNLLWTRILNIPSYMTQSSYSVFKFGLVCCGIFLVAAALEYVRKLIFSKFEKNISMIVEQLVLKYSGRLDN